MSRLFWLRFQKISLILFFGEKDGDQGADQQQIGVKEPAHDLEGGQGNSQLGSGGNGNQHLGAVGDDSLENAGEGVQQTGRTLRADAVAAAHFLGDGVCHDDGHRVVGGGDVHGAHQQTDAQLAAAFSPEESADGVEQGVKAAVNPDQAAHGGHQNGYHAGFKHTGGTGAHAGQQLRGSSLAGSEHNETAGDNADEKHHKNVDARDAPCQHQHIGQNLHQTVAVLRGGGSLTQCQQENEYQSAQGGGQGNAEIAPEFVLHGAALAVAGGNGGVGNEGQIVAEHGAAHHRAHAQGGVVARGLSHLHGNGSDEGDGAHAGAHGGGDKAGHHKQNGYREIRRDQIQHEIGYALGRASTHHPHKGTGGEENQQHGDDVLIANPLSHNGELIIETELPVLQAGHQNGRQKSNDNGNAVKAHGNFHAVFEQKPQPQVQNQKYPNGQQCNRISFFHSSSPK